ncbi:peptide ABC transporter [Ammoniphilus oxalaticus]|uniref:Peptide ABC transporter n=1 Tax=Ammoniphilus oxalaticus TaxID=66863 RepID=A0A419SGS8_9BACL|nr:ATP-binding cassette domain-containing protein [Ammoniphilus oxalaticus]RKD23002.1 peptide ABC transporter [Ammoniphilus oxalaticus]
MSLKASNLSFRYGRGPWLFRDVNMTIEPGEVVGLVGPSGVGKTTFARILAGYEQPRQGSVELDGQPLPTDGFHPVQLVWQHPEQAVNPRWRMREIVSEGGQPDPKLLEMLGIQREWMNRWPNELSGGELQRFCVARALGPNTKFLIADEMTTMLDAITQAQIWQAALEYAQPRNIGLLVISHEQLLIDRLCSRVIHFTEGQIEQIKLFGG